MMSRIWPVLLSTVIVTAGCATPKAPPGPSPEVDLQVKLDDAISRLDLAMQENKDLRRRMVLSRKYQEIEGESFVSAEKDFKGGLAADIATGDVAVRATNRGIGVVILSEKLFATGTDTLQDGGRELLDRIAAFIQKLFPENYIYIEGHTDNQSPGILEYQSNWEFSFARALSVLRYLTEKKGLDPLRLSASGFGQYRPAAANDTREGRSLNRRIEILITPQKLKGPAV